MDPIFRREPGTGWAMCAGRHGLVQHWFVEGYSACGMLRPSKPPTAEPDPYRPKCKNCKRWIRLWERPKARQFNSERGQDGQGG
jgi:hypothetical protein